jgi:hypothetical protein
MPEDNQDLFNVMDSALKRQGEGRTQRFRTAEERKAKPPSQRAEPPKAPVAPSAPAMPEPPAMPAVPEPPAAAGPGGYVRTPDYQRSENQPHTADISRRLYPMPESARIMPASGSLSPGQVLRGTVFSGTRFRPGAAQGQPEPQEMPEPEPPMPAAAAAPQAPQPAPAPVYGTPSTRQVPASSLSTTLRSRPSGLLSPSVRPSGVMPAQSFVPTPSHTVGGFMVRTEVAMVVMVCMVVGLVGSFLLGHTMGESSAQRNAPAKSKLEKPPVTDTVPRPIANLDNPTPAPAPAPVVTPTPTPTPAPVVTPTPAPAGRFTVRVRGYTEKATADNLANQLRTKHFEDVRVVPSGGLYLVLAGHFATKTDPGIEKLRKDLIAKVTLPPKSKPLNPEAWPEP